jgi:hypothetical protein
VDRPDPGAGGGGTGSHIVVGRALAVIVAAVVLGVLIVHTWGTRSTATVPTTTVPLAGSSTTTTSRPSASTSTTTPHGQVKVLVANDSTTNGVASGYSTALQRAGWNMLSPQTAKPPLRATSEVFYATNKRLQADDVALALGLPLSDVLPVSPATPVTSVAGADVIVVLGADLAAKTPPSTVPASATTTSRPATSTSH